MGRNMTDRVIPYAEKNGADFYKGTPKWVSGALEEERSAMIRIRRVSSKRPFSRLYEVEVLTDGPTELTG